MKPTDGSIKGTKTFLFDPSTSTTIPIRSILSFYLFFRNCSFFKGSIFCSSVVLSLTFKTRDKYNFITTKTNIPENLIPFFNGTSFLYYCFLKSGATNEPKSLFLLKSKEVRVIYSKQDKLLLLLKP